MQALEKLDKEIGDLCFFQAFDVSKSEDVENFAQSVERMRGYSLTVNNAESLIKCSSLKSLLKNLHRF